MELKEHIDYWVKTSNEDYEVFNLLLKSEKYLHAFFLAHLSIEKLIKAIWVKDNNNSVPPKVHNLLSLIKQTKAEISGDNLAFLAILNDFQIQGRYPDYKLKIYNLLTKDYVEELIIKTNKVRKCLLEKIV